MTRIPKGNSKASAAAGPSRYMNSGSALAMAAVVAASAFSAAPAQAQDELGVIEEIVVTAQFREQQLQTTPVAISAFTGDTLEARSQTSVDQIQNQSPNVTLKPQGQAFGPSMGASIRGVGQFDFNPALEPGVGVYIDDVYYGTLTGSAFDLLDIQRVEVLRGPQGILAGKNAIGGAIKVYSKQPGDGNSQVSATYGSRDRLDFRGTADFNITDNLAARISGVSKKQDGYIDRIDYGCANPDSAIPADLGSETDCVVAKESETDSQAARAMLRWTPDSDVEVNLIADYTHNDSTQTGNVLLRANYPSSPFVDNDINPYDADIAFDDRFVPDEENPYYNYGSYVSGADDVNYVDGELPASRADGRSDYEGWGVSGQIDWDLTDSMTLTSITGYRAHTTRYSNDDDASPLAHSLGRNTIDYWQFTQEVRLNGAVGPNNDVEYTLGGFYMDERTTLATFQDLRYAGVPPFQGDDPVDAENISAFGHLSWYVTNNLTLLGGLRYTDESKDYTYTRRNRDGTPHVSLGPLDGVTGSYDGNRVDYRAAVQYQWTENIMTYAQTSTGFKGGGVNPRPFSVDQVESFDKETLTSYEVGLKSDLFDRMARINLAAFYSDYSDIQLTPNSCPNLMPSVPCALPKNLGSAEMKGVELEADIQPTERLSMDGSVSYIDFDYTSFSDAAPVPVEPEMVAPNTPKWKWSAGVQYRIDLANMGSLTPRFDASYQGDIHSDVVNRPVNKIEDYVLANARLTWIGPDQDWEAALEVTNVFDKYYFLTKFDLTGAGAGLATGQPGAPREWALTVKRRF